MTMFTKLLCLAGVLVLGACSTPDRFNGSNTGITPDTYNSGIDSNNLGGANDPASVAYFSQSIGDRVLFAVDQSTLSGEARQVLDGQSRWLNTNGNYSIIVEGHADEQGTREYNLALSAKRASAVQQYLVSQGISAARIRTVPYGKERPLEICSAEACYAKNRRAVTVLNSGLSS